VSACANPIPFETLAALWTGDLGAPEANAVEEHLFSCDRCAGVSDRLARLVGGLHEAIPPVISHAHRDRLVRAGRQIKTTRVRAVTLAHAHFTRDIDYMVLVLHADLSRAERVDVEVVRPGGEVALEMQHVPFDAKAGEVLMACQRHYQAFGNDAPTFRVLAVEGGERRPVGEYVVVHHWE
jgi:hypothetical protein